MTYLRGTAEAVWECVLETGGRSYTDSLLNSSVDADMAESLKLVNYSS